jgi:hypothetical protein
MKFKEIKEIIGKEISTKKLKEIISKISSADFKREMKKKGSIINIIKRKIKQS